MHTFSKEITELESHCLWISRGSVQVSEDYMQQLQLGGQQQSVLPPTCDIPLDCVCTYCGRSFTSAGSVTRHVKTVHLRQRFTCYKCGTSFGRVDNLTRHCRSFCWKRHRPEQSEWIIWKIFKMNWTWTVKLFCRYLEKLLLCSSIINCILRPGWPCMRTVHPRRWQQHSVTTDDLRWKSLWLFCAIL